MNGFNNSKTIFKTFYFQCTLHKSNESLYYNIKPVPIVRAAVDGQGCIEVVCYEPREIFPFPKFHVVPVRYPHICATSIHVSHKNGVL